RLWHYRRQCLFLTRPDGRGPSSLRHDCRPFGHRTHRIVSFAGVPAMFVALLYTPDSEKYDTSSLQACVSGSAPLPVAILEGFEQKFGCRILEGYGLSEASAALTGHSLEFPRKPGSVGKALPGVELLVVDQNDQPVPVGEVGEVIARGPNIMQVYYNMRGEP